MNVFLSWSGPKSRAVAEKLRLWLPDVIQSVKPWMSAEDIEAGARWSREIEEQLKETKYGIVCLTRSNTKADWVLFEAGALAKSIQDTYVCPFLIDLEPSYVPRGPLTLFQSKKSNKEGTWELVRSLNRALGDKALDEERLRRTFERCWPDLEGTLNSLPEEGTGPVVARPDSDVLAEVLDLVRELARRAATEEEIIRLLGRFPWLGQTIRPSRDLSPDNILWSPQAWFKLADTDRLDAQQDPDTGNSPEGG